MSTYAYPCWNCIWAAAALPSLTIAFAPRCFCCIACLTLRCLCHDVRVCRRGPSESAFVPASAFVFLRSSSPRNLLLTWVRDASRNSPGATIKQIPDNKRLENPAILCQAHNPANWIPINDIRIANEFLTIRYNGIREQPRRNRGCPYLIPTASGEKPEVTLFE